MRLGQQFGVPSAHAHFRAETKEEKAHTMNPTGQSDTSESKSPHTEGEHFGDRWSTRKSELPPETLTGELGQPAGDIEIVADEMTSLPPAGRTSAEGELDVLVELDQGGGGWFRWWYIPATLVPVAAGAATTLWLVNRRRRLARRQRQLAVLRMYSGLADRTSGWWNDLTGPRAIRRARKTTRRAAKSARSSANDLNDRAAAVLAAIGAVALAERARMLWERSARSARAVRRPTRASEARKARARAEWRQTIAAWLNGANASARSQAASMLSGATAPVRGALSSASARTQGALTAAGDSVSSTARTMRAFAFGAVLSSIATYLGLTRRRADQPMAGETTGRQVPRSGRSRSSGSTPQAAAGGRGR